MKIVVRFYSNTSSPYVTDAISLAENCEHFKERNYYFVQFNEPDDKLQKLLKIVGSWKTTQIHLNDQEVDVHSFIDTFFCPDQLLCNGICTHLRIGFSRLDYFLEKMFIKYGVGFIDKHNIQELSPFLEKTEDNKFKLNKNKLQEFIKSECSFELENCQYINKEKIFNLVKKFPDIIDINERYADYPDDEEDLKNIEDEKRRVREANIEFAEILADAFEKRLRTVLNEYFDKK